MGEWPESSGGMPRWAPTHIHSYSRWSAGAAARVLAGTSNPTSLSWGTANSGIYVPLTLSFPYLVSRVFWVNGSSATGSVDVGVYTDDGAKVFSIGSTAQSGASAPQYVALGTPILLPAAQYFLALSCNNTTNKLWGLGLTSAQGKPIGLLTQASVATLPAVATFAAYASTLGFPIFGITRTASGF